MLLLLLGGRQARRCSPALLPAGRQLQLQQRRLGLGRRGAPGRMLLLLLHLLPGKRGHLRGRWGGPHSHSGPPQVEGGGSAGRDASLAAAADVCIVAAANAALPPSSVDNVPRALVPASPGRGCGGGGALPLLLLLLVSLLLLGARRG